MNSDSVGTSAMALGTKILAGLGGGLLGTAAALLMSTLIQVINASSHPLVSEEFSGANMVILVFSATFVGNLSAIFFLIMSHKDKYRAKKQIFQGAFFVNIFLFIVGLPFYMFLPQGEFLISIAGIHVFLSACSTALVAEIFSGVKYAVSGVVGISLAQMIFLLSYVGMGLSSNAIMIVIFLPFIWSILPIFLFISEIISFQMMKTLEQ